MTITKKAMRTAVIATAMCITAGSVSARTWRVNPNPAAKAEFTTVTEALANEALQPGDELILDAGDYTSEGTITISKPNITITGPGYALAENTDWAESRSAKCGIRINAANTTIQGLEMGTIEITGTCSDVVIQRCKFGTISCNASNCKKFTIRQNLITGQGIYNGIVITTVDECTISNNIVRSRITVGKNSIIEHNIFPNVSTWTYGDRYYNLISCINSIVRNNILIETNGDVRKGEYLIDFAPSNNNVITNNIFSAPIEKANQNYLNNGWVDATMKSVFVDEVGVDGYFLREGSPAKGAASDGGDCGIFGGAHPYVQSGRPQNMPHITSAQIPSSPTDGELVVKLKIEVQND